MWLTPIFYQITAQKSYFCSVKLPKTGEVTHILDMEKLLFALLILLASCTGKAPEKEESDYFTDSEVITETIEEEPDTVPPFTVSKSKSGGYNLWQISENPRKVSELPYNKYETSPAGLFDRPASTELKSGEPLYYKDATWSAACRALKNLVPNPDAKIIYNFAKLDRQINSNSECLYIGECEIKNKNGKYVPAEINIRVRWAVPNDYREASGWYCVGSIVF